MKPIIVINAPWLMSGTNIDELRATLEAAGYIVIFVYDPKGVAVHRQ